MNNTSGGLPRALYPEWNRRKSRGFISLGIIIAIVIGVAVLGGAGWWMNTQQTDGTQPSSPQESQRNKVFYVVYAGDTPQEVMMWVYGGWEAGSVKIEEADPKTFMVTGDYTAKDTRHTYEVSGGYLLIDGNKTRRVAPSSNRYFDETTGLSIALPEDVTITANLNDAELVAQSEMMSSLVVTGPSGYRGIILINDAGRGFETYSRTISDTTIRIDGIDARKYVAEEEAATFSRSAFITFGRDGNRYFFRLPYATPTEVSISQAIISNIQL